MMKRRRLRIHRAKQEEQETFKNEDKIADLECYHE